MRDFIIILLSLSMLPKMAGALDALGKTPRERPEIVDVSNTVSNRYETLYASYETDFLEVPMNEVHSWRLSLKDKKGQPVVGADIDPTADMPEHLHGMTTNPLVQEAETPGLYIVRGMNFHMPGYWEVTLDISGAGSRYLLRFELIVGENQCAPTKVASHEG